MFCALQLFDGLVSSDLCCTFCLLSSYVVLLMASIIRADALSSHVFWHLVTSRIRLGNGGFHRHRLRNSLSVFHKLDQRRVKFVCFAQFVLMFFASCLTKDKTNQSNKFTTNNPSRSSESKTRRPFRKFRHRRCTGKREGNRRRVVIRCILATRTHS